MMKRNYSIAVAGTVLSTAISMTAFAGGWRQENTTGRWWYEKDFGGITSETYGWFKDAEGKWYKGIDSSLKINGYCVNGWWWIYDTESQGMKSYYFDSQGYLYTNTTTPDGYQVNEKGEWVKDGVVQLIIPPAPLAVMKADFDSTQYLPQNYEANVSVREQKGGWQKDGTGWWYKRPDGLRCANGWWWIYDSNIQGLKCYYFDAQGHMLAGSTAPDGSLLNANGEWVQNGTVQVQVAQSGREVISHADLQQQLYEQETYEDESEEEIYDDEYEEYDSVDDEREIQEQEEREAAEREQEESARAEQELAEQGQIEQKQEEEVQEQPMWEAEQDQEETTDSQELVVDTSQNNNETNETESSEETEKTSEARKSAYEAQNKEDYAKEVVRLVNIERSRVGLNELEWDDTIASYATERAAELISQMAHVRPNGTAFSTIFKEYGMRFKLAGENFAAGQIFPSIAVEQWMLSPSHRDNILREGFTKTGVGCYINESTTYQIYWVQLFVK